jgi:hypothetical protein
VTDQTRGPVVVEAGEWSSDELIAALDEGRRVIVRAEFLGETREVTMRWDGETYYCDTPTRLHKHQDAEGMRDCLLRLGYASDEP